MSKGKYRGEKPRWSPDGKTIYLGSHRSGFFNVWGIYFDTAGGRPSGEPLRVTKFESPGLMVPEQIPFVGLAVAIKLLAGRDSGQEAKIKSSEIVH
jgi:hypothetical protein